MLPPKLAMSTAMQNSAPTPSDFTSGQHFLETFTLLHETTRTTNSWWLQRFFPSYETCSININSLFHAAIKNLHIKANGIFVFFILLYFTTTLSKGITHTRTQEHISSQKVITTFTVSLKMVTNIHIAK